MVHKESLKEEISLEQLGIKSNDMSEYHLTQLLNSFEYSDVRRALEKGPWATLELVFGFEIPLDLFSVIQTLYERNEVNESDKNDLETMIQVKNLYHEFKVNFGRLPKVFPYFIYASREFNSDLICKSFKVKSLRYALTLTEEINSIHHQIVLSIIFGNKIFDVVTKLKQYNRDIYNFISGLPPKYPIKNQDLLNWIIKHVGNTPNQVIHEVATLWEEQHFPRSGKVSDMKYYISKKRADKEWIRCAQKYPDIFSNTFNCNIKDSPFLSAEESARILDPNDKIQVLLGSLTVCCQKLDSGGEPSMMEGLVNPNSGFLVFERKNKIIAQAWIWLSKEENVLVLDNIELADERKPEDIIHLIEIWVRKSPYQNIQMGIGYNRISVGTRVDGELSWYKQHWPLRYTDAFNRVWLKKEGVVDLIL